MIEILQVFVLSIIALLEGAAVGFFWKIDKKKISVILGILSIVSLLILSIEPSTPIQP